MVGENECPEERNFVVRFNVLKTAVVKQSFSNLKNDPIGENYPVLTRTEVFLKIESMSISSWQCSWNIREIGGCYNWSIRTVRLGA